MAAAAVHSPSQREESAREMPPPRDVAWLVPFALVYLTFFLDNVLLTVLVPIIPEWIRGEAVSQWMTSGGVAAHNVTDSGAAQAAVGLVLSAKAGAQLAAAGPAAAAVCRVGPARVLRAGTALLLLASLMLSAVAGSAARGGAAAWGAGCARAAQGAGAAGAGVGGLALAAAAAPPAAARHALAALLGAVALGVLVGYPFGGATYALWSRATPFLIISLALAADLLMQYKFLDKEEYNRGWWCAGEAGWSPRRLWRAAGAGRGAGGAAAGAVLLTTAVMAALEPTLPLWIADKFHPQRWVGGVVFVPDSAAYLVSASVLGALCGGLGAARRGALGVAGVCAVAGAALAIPHAASVAWLAWPHTLLGLGLGATDAALVPALLAPAPPAPTPPAAAPPAATRSPAAPRAPRRTPHRAALLQAAASAAYVIGPVAGGLCSWAVGFPATMRALGVANLLYAVVLHRALTASQWDEDDDDDEEEEETPHPSGEDIPLTSHDYATLH